MKKLLDWQDKAVVNIFDEVTLWSAPFGRLLLDLIPSAQHSRFFQLLKEKLALIINKRGAFEMKIPMLYMEFKKV